MPWIIKQIHSFNRYLGENCEIVTGISLAKEFKTKKEATEYSKGIRTPLEVIKKTNI